MRKKLKIFLLSACALVLALGAIAVAACGGGDGGEDPILYTVSVTCEKANALSGVKVEIKKSGTSVETKGLTDGKAEFRLAPDTYQASIVESTLPEGYVSDPAMATLTAKAPNKTFALVEEGTDDPTTVTYTVKVLMPDGSPAAGLNIQLCTEATGGTNEGCYPATTDATGTATLELEENTYELHIDTPPAGTKFDNTEYKVTAESPSLTARLDYADKIEYVVNVTCADNVLDDVEVTLSTIAQEGDGTAEDAGGMSERKPLVNGSATFLLAPDVYFVTLHLPDYIKEDYTYAQPDALTPSSPSVAIEIVPNVQEFTVNVSCENAEALTGITVEVFQGDVSVLVAPLVNGSATFELERLEYTVALKNVPEHYVYVANQSLNVTHPALELELLYVPWEGQGTEDDPFLLTDLAGSYNIKLPTLVMDIWDARPVPLPYLFSYTPDADKTFTLVSAYPYVGIFLVAKKDYSAGTVSSHLVYWDGNQETSRTTFTLKANTEYLMTVEDISNEGNRMVFTIAEGNGADVHIFPADIAGDWKDDWTNDGSGAHVGVTVENNTVTADGAAADITAISDKDGVFTLEFTAGGANYKLTYTYASKELKVEKNGTSYTLQKRVIIDDKPFEGSINSNLLGTYHNVDDRNEILIVEANSVTWGNRTIELKVNNWFEGFTASVDGEIWHFYFDVNQFFVYKNGDTIDHAIVFEK